MVSAALIAVALYLIFFAPNIVFMAAAVLMSLLCYSEFSGLVAAHAMPRPGILGVIAGLLTLFYPSVLGLSLAAVVAFVSALRYSTLRDVLPYVACVLLGAFYTFAPWRFSADLRHVSAHLLFFALAINWIGDTAAYYVGRRFGKHRLAPVVSPNKSWEGVIASLVGGVIFGLLYLHYFMPAIAWWEIVGMAVLGNAAGQLGDLVESAMKRGAGVKDSGNLLPGHGGMLDRVDSSLFALPVVYACHIVSRYLPHQ